MDSSYFILCVNVIDQCSCSVMICYYWHHGDRQTGYRSVCSLVVWEWGWVWFLFMCHNVLSFYQNTSMIITLICCKCVAIRKEGEDSPPLHTHIIACTNAHTHTIFTLHASSHDGLHQTWNNRVMSSMHMLCRNTYPGGLEKSIRLIALLA